MVNLKETKMGNETKFQPLETILALTFIMLMVKIVKERKLKRHMLLIDKETGIELETEEAYCKILNRDTLM